MDMAGVLYLKEWAQDGLSYMKADKQGGRRHGFEKLSSRLGELDMGVYLCSFNPRRSRADCHSQDNMIFSLPVLVEAGSQHESRNERSEDLNAGKSALYVHGTASSIRPRASSSGPGRSPTRGCMSMPCMCSQCHGFVSYPTITDQTRIWARE